MTANTTQRVLETIHGVDVVLYGDGRVSFTTGAAIDADGSNGQFGKRVAYNTTDTGSDLLANGGMKLKDGRVVFSAHWGRDVAISDVNGEPRVFSNGVIASKTAYRLKGMASNDPDAYLDAETIPYIVVPPCVVMETKGAVLGCKVIVTNTVNGEVHEGIVGDVGPSNSVGEVSVALARLLGIPADPRNGGADKPVIKYEVFPGVKSGQFNLPLLSANGTYV